jgi:hypothetical protein
VNQPTIRQSSKGPAVQLAQTRLAGKGFFTSATIDGKFGPVTDAAVQRFQAACGVPADGIVGPVTWSLLMAEGTAPTPADVLAQRKVDLFAMVSPSTPARARSVVEAAIGALGLREVPPGSNGGPELVPIVGGNGRPPSAYWLYAGVTDPKKLAEMPPWCVLFVCWALRDGLKVASWRDIPFGRWMASSSAVEEWAKDAGLWRAVVPGVPVPSGAIFTVGSKAAVHTALVVADVGKIVTIEGNVSNCVGSLERSRDELRGYAVWDGAASRGEETS